MTRLPCQIEAESDRLASTSRSSVAPTHDGTGSEEARERDRDRCPGHLPVEGDNDRGEYRSGGAEPIEGDQRRRPVGCRFLTPACWLRLHVLVVVDDRRLSASATLP
jgi:hypothetical protein